jgi:hypothetical protein
MTLKPDEDDDIGSIINELLRGGVEQLHLKFGEPVSNVSGRWYFCEITESPDDINRKLFRLERAVYILTRANPYFEISGCVILINGSEEAATVAIESFFDDQDCCGCKIYIIYFICKTCHIGIPFCDYIPPDRR